MGHRSSAWVAPVLVLLALAFAGALVPTPLVALGPGPTFDTLGEHDGKQVVTAGGLPTFPTSGHLNMTTVGVSDGLTTFQALTLWASGAYQLAPRSTIYPPGMSGDQVSQTNQSDFDSSVANAEAAALGYLRLPARVTVGALTPGSPSAGLLAEGDQIVAVGGRPVTSVSMLLDALRTVPPGRPVEVRIQRGDDPPRAVTVVPIPKPDEPGRAVLGVTVGTAPLQGDKISITLADVGGPSAGLMFSLALVDKLTPGALTGGRFVAGTGTIDPAGKVGQISGIRFKMAMAREEGATTFLVPAGNCAEALADAPDGLALVRVGTLDDAVRALDTLRAGGAPPSCS